MFGKETPFFCWLSRKFPTFSSVSNILIIYCNLGKTVKNMKNGQKSLQQVLLYFLKKKYCSTFSYFLAARLVLVLGSSSSFFFVSSSCCDFRFVVSALESQLAIKFFDFFSASVIPIPASSRSTLKYKWASLFFTLPTLLETGCHEIWKRTKDSLSSEF